MKFTYRLVIISIISAILPSNIVLAEEPVKFADKTDDFKIIKNKVVVELLKSSVNDRQIETIIRKMNKN